MVGTLRAASENDKQADAARSVPTALPLTIVKTEPTQEARAEAKFILIMPSNKEEKTTRSD